MGHRRLLLLLAACAAILPTAARAEALIARYEVHAAGMTVMQVEALLDLDGPYYLVRTRSRMRGLAGWLASGDQVTTAEGRWRGTEPVPARYRTEGVWRGSHRLVAIDYAPSGQPLLRAIEPPNIGEREPVPEEMQRGTVDSLSALAKLTRTVALTGRCDTAAPVFDGRRRSEAVIRTISLDRLPAEGAYAGEALRCAFESRMLAGFRLGEDTAKAREPQPATAWIARPRPNAPPLPVRIDMASRWFGTLHVVLTAVEPAPPGEGSAQAVAQQRR